MTELALQLALLALGCLSGLVYFSIKTGEYRGRHRKSAAALYGCADQSPDPSPGRSAQIIPLPYSSLAGAANAFSSPYGAASAHAQRQQMTHAPAHTPLGFFGTLAQVTPAQQLQALQALQALQTHNNAQLQLRQQQALQQAMLTRLTPRSPPHEPTVLKSEGIHAGEIIAWRAWHISDNKLTSVVADTFWNPVEPTQGDPAGGFGIHAYKSPHGPMMDHYADADQAGLWVIGEVALWGDVIEHERGYRAEYARVHSLVTWSRIVPDFTRNIISEKYLGRTMTDDPLPPAPLS